MKLTVTSPTKARYSDLVRSARREILLRALAHNDYNRTHTASWLGMSRSELQNMLKKLAVVARQPPRPTMQRDDLGLFVGPSGRKEEARG